eukprot:m.111106 g.111106  ORF g.111106 m.111106 type:complete len:949 (+) comp9232_c1_seq3:509-3355(+)
MNNLFGILHQTTQTTATTSTSPPPSSALSSSTSTTSMATRQSSTLSMRSLNNVYGRDGMNDFDDDVIFEQWEHNIFNPFVEDKEQLEFDVDDFQFIHKEYASKGISCTSFSQKHSSEDEEDEDEEDNMEEDKTKPHHDEGFEKSKPSPTRISSFKGRGSFQTRSSLRQSRQKEGMKRKISRKEHKRKRMDAVHDVIFTQELLEHIFQYLDVTSLARCSCVCKLFNVARWPVIDLSTRSMPSAPRLVFLIRKRPHVLALPSGGKLQRENVNHLMSLSGEDMAALVHPFSCYQLILRHSNIPISSSPMSCLLDGIRVLDLAGSLRVQENLCHLARCLPQLNQLRQLIIADNALTLTHLVTLFGNGEDGDGTTILPRLEVLDVSDNNFGNDGVELLSRRLLQMNQLKELRACTLDCDGSGMRALASSLPPSCTSLSLAEDIVNTDTCTLFFNAAKGLKRLRFESLDIDEQALNHLFHAFKKSTSLEYMYLKDIHLSPSSAQILGEALQENTSLKHLHLNFNHLNSAALKHVARGLRRNKVLVELSLDHNCVFDDGVRELTMMLFENTTLETLCMRDCGLRNNAILALARVLSRNRTLQSLNLRQNIDDPTTLKAFLQILADGYKSDHLIPRNHECMHERRRRQLPQLPFHQSTQEATQLHGYPVFHPPLSQSSSQSRAPSSQEENHLMRERNATHSFSSNRMERFRHQRRRSYTISNDQATTISTSTTTTSTPSSTTTSIKSTSTTSTITSMTSNLCGCGFRGGVRHVDLSARLDSKLKLNKDVFEQIHGTLPNTYLRKFVIHNFITNKLPPVTATPPCSPQPQRTTRARRDSAVGRSRSRSKSSSSTTNNNSQDCDQHSHPFAQMRGKAHDHVDDDHSNQHRPIHLRNCSSSTGIKYVLSRSTTHNTIEGFPELIICEIQPLKHGQFATKEKKKKWWISLPWRSRHHQHQ